MSIHIEAKPGQIAPAILLPGDPLRAKFIAEKFLESPVCYNQVRNMFGYTGDYKGKRISVQGTGMGMPSHHIYVHELIHDYGCRVLIRVGTCGAIQPEIKLRDVILAMGASTNSGMNLQRFRGMDFAAVADYGLLKAAADIAAQRGMPVRVGAILSSDTFYDDDPDAWKLWQKYGVLAIEMETNELYTLAAQARVRALSLLTVSDQIISGERASAEDRQTAFTQMVEVALDTAAAFS